MPLNAKMQALEITTQRLLVTNCPMHCKMVSVIDPIDLRTRVGIYNGSHQRIALVIDTEKLARDAGNVKAVATMLREMDSSLHRLEGDL